MSAAGIDERRRANEQLEACITVARHELAPARDVRVRGLRAKIDRALERAVDQTHLEIVRHAIEPDEVEPRLGGLNAFSDPRDVEDPAVALRRDLAPRRDERPDVGGAANARRAAIPVAEEVATTSPSRRGRRIRSVECVVAIASECRDAREVPAIGNVSARGRDLEPPRQRIVGRSRIERPSARATATGLTAASMGGI